MQPSYYLKTYPSPANPEQLLLFSTKRASLILLDRETWQDLEQGTLAPEAEARLTALGLAVADREAEKQAMLSLLDEQNLQNRGLRIVCILNLDCNFACPYCFEEGLKGDLYMSNLTAERLLAFIAGQWTDHKDTLAIDFYGGEPLLSLELLESLARSARSFAGARGASYYFTLVTNGSLFTRKTAERLVPLGLKGIKVTLDGPAEIHNRYRPFKTGAGSFRAIMENIKATCDLVKINIGGNYTREDYARFPLLLDDLEAAGLTPGKIGTVKFDPIVNRPKNAGAPIEYASGCASINEPWIIAAEAFLREEIMRRGYKTSKPSPMACAIENRGALVVNFDGVLYKCPAFTGKEEFAAGDLERGIVDYGETYRVGLYKNQECAACVYLPMCFGGCRFMAYLREGNFATLDCKKEYFDAALETLLKQDIRYRLRK